MKLRATLAVGWLSIVTAAPLSALESWRPEEFWCRGPLGFGYEYVGDDRGVYLYFEGSRRPAGANGQNLEPGTCAWATRAFGAGDPPKLFLNYITGTSPGYIDQNRKTDHVLHWALTPDLRFWFNAGVGTRRVIATVRQVMPPLRTWLEERRCAQPACPKPGEKPPGKELF